MVLPGSIVEIFSREARKFVFLLIFLVNGTCKKLTTTGSKCCITFDQMGVRRQTWYRIEAFDVVYSMGCHVERSTWNTVAKRRVETERK